MIRYQDTVRLIDLAVDGYNDKVVDTDVLVKALFHLGASYSNENADTLYESDAHVYLDPRNSEVLSAIYRLEGWYIVPVATPFAYYQKESWYRIERVVVGQRKLLNNNVDNVHCFLKKVAAPTELAEES